MAAGVVGPIWRESVPGRESRLSIVPTLVWLGATLAFATFCGWRGGRLPDPHRGARMVPWRLLMVTAAAAAFFLFVHLLNLAGVRTGGR